jgi:hypothetical protein
VFPGDTGEYLDGAALRRRYATALSRAGLRALRFHDLRHTFGTRIIAKADIRRVQEWMGHADVQTTMRYLHYAPRADDARLVAEAFQIDTVPGQPRKSSFPGTRPATSRDVYEMSKDVRPRSGHRGRARGYVPELDARSSPRCPRATVTVGGPRLVQDACRRARCACSRLDGEAAIRARLRVLDDRGALLRCPP